MCENPISNLSPNDYQLRSPETKAYNAIAWAIGEHESDRWWSPEPFSSYYWPQDIPKRETLENYTKLFALHHYYISTDDTLESDFEKIAIYGRGGIPTHVARQQNDGWWTSKLGKFHDITHRTLACLEGERSYGTVLRILKREKRRNDTV